MLRNVNERFACPILLIGEEELKGKIGSRRRLANRMRYRMEFGPISKEDIAFYIESSLGVKVGADITTAIHRHAKGSWRPVTTVTLVIDQSMKTSNLKGITMEIINDAIRKDEQKSPSSRE